jgi:hypothetical protein
VAVGVVPGDAVLQPEDVGYAEVVAKEFFIVEFGEAGIAFLNLALQALFGGEERAQAVGVDRATFKHNTAAVVHWQKEPAANRFICTSDDLCIFFVIRIFCPTVEDEMIQGNVPGAACEADGAGIAQPSAIRRNAQEKNVVEVSVSSMQD